MCMVVKSRCDFSITLPPSTDSLEIMAILLDVKLNCSFAHIKNISERLHQLNDSKFLY